MAVHTKRVFSGIAVGATPGVLLWVIGAIVGGEALLSFGVIGMLLATVGMVIGGVVGAGGERSGSAARPAKAAIGAVIGCVPGVVLLFFMTRIAILVILGGDLIGAFVGGRVEAGGGRPTPVQ